MIRPEVPKVRLPDEDLKRDDDPDPDRAVLPPFFEYFPEVPPFPFSFPGEDSGPVPAAMTGISPPIAGPGMMVPVYVPSSAVFEVPEVFSVDPVPPGPLPPEPPPPVPPCGSIAAEDAAGS